METRVECQLALIGGVRLPAQILLSLRRHRAWHDSLSADMKIVLPDVAVPIRESFKKSYLTGCADELLALVETPSGTVMLHGNDNNAIVFNITKADPTAVAIGGQFQSFGVIEQAFECERVVECAGPFGLSVAFHGLLATKTMIADFAHQLRQAVESLDREESG